MALFESPISGFGLSCVIVPNLDPNPPANITTFIYSLLFSKNNLSDYWLAQLVVFCYEKMIDTNRL